MNKVIFLLFWVINGIALFFNNPLCLKIAILLNFIISGFIFSFYKKTQTKLDGFFLQLEQQKILTAEFNKFLNEKKVGERFGYPAITRSMSVYASISDILPFLEKALFLRKIDQVYCVRCPECDEVAISEFLPSHLRSYLSMFSCCKLCKHRFKVTENNIYVAFVKNAE